MYEEFEKRKPYAPLDTNNYPPEVRGRFNSFITTQFDDSLSVEMQIRSLIKWITSTRELVNDMADYLNLFIEQFDKRLQQEIVTRLNNWLEDGTLAHVINKEVFDMKANTEDLEALEDLVANELERIENEINQKIQQTEEKVTYNSNRINQHHLNIKDYLNGNNATPAIEQALSELTEKGGGTLYFPNGQYDIRTTLTIPSNISLIGESKKSTVFMFHNSGSYRMDSPLDIQATTDRYRYRIGIQTESFGSQKSQITENLLIKHITFDWNHVESEPYSIAPIAIDSAKNIYFEDIEVKRAYNTFSSRAGCNVLVSFSENVYFEQTILNGADYEALSVRYLSKNVRFNNGQLYSNKASQYGGQTHLFQVATPPYAENWLQNHFGEYKAGTLYVTNSTGVIEGNCSHFGTAHTGGGLVVENNTFVSKGNSKLHYGLKTFSNSDNSRFINNRLILEKFGDTIPNALALDDASHGSGGNSNFEISGNTVEVIFPTDYYHQSEVVLTKPIVGGMDRTTNFNGQITNNRITVRNYPNRPIRVIGIMGNRVSVSDNVISTQDPYEENTSAGMIAIYVEAMIDCVISRNMQGGQKIAYGVRFANDSDIQRSLLVDNTFGWVVQPLSQTAGYNEIIVNRNYPPTDE